MNKKYILLSVVLPYYLFSNTELNEVNIYEDAIQSTNSVDINLEQTEQHQANSVFDMLENESSIDVAGGASNAKRIYIRGNESSTLNITLDGATQGKNIFQHRGNELGVNPDILKVVNVKTAPDASKSGSLGGAIEMETKDAQDFIKNGKTQGAILRLGYATNTNSNIGSLTSYGFYDGHYGILASVSKESSENYKDGNNNEMLGTAYEDRNYLLKFNISDINNHNIKISFNQNTNGGDMQWGKTGSDKGIIYDSSLLEEIESTTTNYTVQHNYSKGKLLNLDTNLNFTNVLVDRIDENSEYENDTIGLKVQNHFYIDTTSTKNKISLGFQIEDEESSSNQTISSINASNDPASYVGTSSVNNALFVQNKTSINNLDINYGLRYDTYELQTGLGNASDNTLSPNLGLQYNINPKSMIYANYGKSSRMTGTIPFTWMMNVVDGSTYSDNLKAEKSTRYELGYELREGDLLNNRDSFIFNTNIFRTEIKDLILSYSGQLKANGSTSYAGEGGAPLTDMYNDDEIHIAKGFEIKGSYYLDDYYTSLSYTLIDTNTLIEEYGEPLTVRRVAGFDSQKVVLNTGMEIIEGLMADYTLTAVKGIDNEQLTRAGYTVHDISTKYQKSEESHWTFFVAVSNLTNKHYAPHTTLVGSDDNDYRREIGRNFKFSIKYEL